MSRTEHGQRRRTSTPIPPPLYVVSSGEQVEQVFAALADAERYAREVPGARVSRHHVRESMEEAVIFFDRRVVVTSGATVLDRTTEVRRFIDDPFDAPEPADVEWFHDADDADWHIAGFGVDKAALDAKVQSAIDRVCRSTQRAALGSVR